MTWWPHDWSSILLPDAPIAELLVRAAALYVFLYAALRIVGRRLISRFALADVLVMLLLAVSVRNGVTGKNYTIGDAAISAGTILILDVLIDQIAYAVPPLRRLLRLGPVLIIHEGTVLEKNTRAYRITEPELMEKLRHHGVDSYDQVREAWLEPDGGVSVVKAKTGGVGGSPPASPST